MLKIANILFNHFFWLYRPLYFLYKKQQDKNEISIYKKYIKEGDIVLDIGANIGFTATIFAALVGKKGQVFAFEPDKTNYSKLKKEIEMAKISQVETINKAVSDKSGSITFYTSSSLNVDHRAYKFEDSSGSYQVECVNIDDFLTSTQVPNFIKIDIQGYEYAAFIGMKQTIENAESLIILSEFWPFNLKKTCQHPSELIHLWKSLSLHIYSIHSGKLKNVTDRELEVIYEWPESKYCNFILSKQNLLKHV